MSFFSIFLTDSSDLRRSLHLCAITSCCLVILRQCRVKCHVCSFPIFLTDPPDLVGMIVFCMFAH